LRSRDKCSHLYPSCTLFTFLPLQHVARGYVAAELAPWSSSVTSEKNEKLSKSRGCSTVASSVASMPLDVFDFCNNAKRKTALLWSKSPTNEEFCWSGSCNCRLDFSPLFPLHSPLFSFHSHQSHSHLQLIMSASARLSAVTKQLGSAASSPQGLLAGEVSIITGVR